MEQGKDLMAAEQERDLARAERGEAKADLEKLRVEVDDLKASSSSNAESLVALEAKKGELENRLHGEAKKTEELQRHVDTWAQRKANLPHTIVAKYIESAEFKSFVEQLSVSAF